MALTPPESDKSRESTPENIQLRTRKTRLSVKNAVQNEENTQSAETEPFKTANENLDTDAWVELEPVKNELDEPFESGPLAIEPPVELPQNEPPETEPLPIEGPDPKSDQSEPTETKELQIEPLKNDPLEIEPPVTTPIEKPQIEPTEPEASEPLQIEPPPVSKAKLEIQEDQEISENVSPKPPFEKKTKTRSKKSKNKSRPEKASDKNKSQEHEHIEDEKSVIKPNVSRKLRTRNADELDKKNSEKQPVCQVVTEDKIIKPTAREKDVALQDSIKTRRKSRQKMKPKSVLQKEAEAIISEIREEVKTKNLKSRPPKTLDDDEIPALEKVIEYNSNSRKKSEEIPALERVAIKSDIAHTVEKENQKETFQKKPQKEESFLPIPCAPCETTLNPISSLDVSHVPISIPFSSTPKSLENSRKTPRRLKNLDFDQRSTIGRYFAENSRKQMFEVIKHFELLWNVRFSQYLVKNVQKELSNLNFESNHNTSIEIEVVEDTVSLAIPAIPENTRKRLISEASTGKFYYIKFYYITEVAIGWYENETA